MIRFLDKKVNCIELKEFDRDKLLKYYIDKMAVNKIPEIVLIYDRSRYYGLVTYKSLLAGSNYTGIIREKYVINEGEELFAGLRSIFENSVQRLPCIPVFKTDMQLICFAYQYSTLQTIRIEKYDFSFLESVDECLFIRDLYPQIEKICIYDFNEFAFRFYKLLKNRNFPVEVFGEKWFLLYPDIYEQDHIRFGNAVAESIMNIYAEGSFNCLEPCKSGLPGFRMGGEWNFITEIINANVLLELEKWKKYLREKKIAAFTMIFPSSNELGYNSTDEFYRNRMAVEIETGQLDIKNSLAIEQINKCWSIDSEDKFDKAITVRERHWDTTMVLGDKSVGYKEFGRGQHTLYLIGPCIVGGASVDEEDTFGACLYRYLREKLGGRDFYKVACISADRRDVLILKEIIQSLTLYDGDIVVMINEIEESNVSSKMEGYPGDIDIKKILNRRKSDWFWNSPIHTNQKGNAEISKLLVEEYLAEYLWKDFEIQKEPQLIQVGKYFLPRDVEEEIEVFIANAKVNKIVDQNIGSIVMNCNPMTNGHSYLIEQALQKVDFLYIFLVEEDKSEFSFAERLSMVEAVTSKYDNIKVIPSGKFILSYETLPIYFEKAYKQEEFLDATLDLRIFAEKIAPKLGIKMRFVGEEPFDKITRQYNESMKKILPLFGVQLVEIPRLKFENVIISASLVRKYIREGNLDLVRCYLPEEVYNLLRERGL